MYLIRFIGILALTASINAQALPEPDAKYQRLDRVIARVLANYHYQRQDIDNQLSERIFNHYLDQLDPSRLILLQKDVERLRAEYATSLDEAIQRGNLKPALAIYRSYQQKAQQRYQWLIKQLAHRQFTLKGKDRYTLRNHDTPWVSRPDALDALWIKQIKHTLIGLRLAGKSLAEAKQTLTKRYQQRLRQLDQVTGNDVFHWYANALTMSFDPHTNYLSPRATENFTIQMRLSLEGIGAVLRQEDEAVTVVELVPGGPADQEGSLGPGDQIVGVGQGRQGTIDDVVGWRLDKVVDKIRGQRGTVVRLQVIPAKASAIGGRQLIALKRDTVNLEKQAASSEIKAIEVDGKTAKVGVITIPTFYSDFSAARHGKKTYRSTVQDVAKLLKSMDEESIQGVVIDLRHNGGGSLLEAIALTGLFIDQGPVVQVRNANGAIDVEQDPDRGVAYAGPLAVLVNHYSASASEIFAAAIQDYGRGVVIGEPTFGKGTVQALVDLNRLVANPESSVGQMKMTTAKFYRITGSSTQHLGVSPDIRLPSPYDGDESGESALTGALPWDEIRALSYQRFGDLSVVLPLLRQRSVQRLQTLPSLKEYVEQVKTLQDLRRKKSVSLNWQVRQQQWQDNRQLLGNEQDANDDKKVDTKPDPLLEEAVHIVGDMIELRRTDHVKAAAVSMQY